MSIILEGWYFSFDWNRKCNLMTSLRKEGLGLQAKIWRTQGFSKAWTAEVMHSVLLPAGLMYLIKVYLLHRYKRIKITVITCCSSCWVFMYWFIFIETISLPGGCPVGFLLLLLLLLSGFKFYPLGI